MYTSYISLKLRLKRINEFLIHEELDLRFIVQGSDSDEIVQSTQAFAKSGKYSSLVP